MTNLGFTIFGDMRTAELTPVAGWSHVYNVNADIVNTSASGSGTITHANAMAILSTGAATSSSAHMFTKRVLRYIPGVGGLARLTVIFSTPATGSKQLIGLGTEENGLLIGFIDEDFCVIRRSNSVDNVTTSNNFSYPAPDLDFTKGNVFEINFQWLGYGLIRFSYEDPNTHEFVPFHDIKYPNTAIVPSMLNPTLPFHADVINTTNNTNIVLKTSSAMAFREGMFIPKVGPLTLLRGFDNSAARSTESPLLSVRANTSYQGVTNQIHPVLEAISVSSDGTKNVNFKIYKGGSLTGASWVDYDTNVSSLQYDITASARSGGEFIFDYHLGKADAFTDHVGEWNLVLEPGEILTITAESATSNDVSCSILLDEPF